MFKVQVANINDNNLSERTVIALIASDIVSDVHEVWHLTRTLDKDPTYESGELKLNGLLNLLWTYLYKRRHFDS